MKRRVSVILDRVLSPSPFLMPNCRPLVWLLTALLCLQGAAVGILNAIGPVHVHRAVLTQRLLLDDFRRAGSAQPSHVAAAIGHFHGVESARHHHSLADASVVRADDDGLLQAADAGDGGGHSLATFVAILPAALGWLPRMTSHPMATRAPWPSLTQHPAPLERPPRTV